MDAHLHALVASTARLARLVAPLTDAELAAPSYASEWSIADVLSHLGSGAVILRRRLDDALAGKDMPDDFAPSVWDEWNAKSPRAKADDALAADADAVVRLESLTADERSTLVVAVGPLQLDATAFVALRLNEHVLHTWDVAVALDPSATLPSDPAALCVDNLGLIARYTAKPDGTQRTITVRTTDPARSFAITLDPDSVSFGPAAEPDDGDVVLPAEAFVRLVYGRLDTGHTPAGVTGEATLDELRRVFPGP